MMNLLVSLLRRAAMGLVGWLFLAPWIALVPRRADWIAVIGKQDGMFHDNTKYFYLQAAQLLKSKSRVVMLTERDDVMDMLTSSGFEVLRYPTWQAIWYLLRCGTLVIDEAAWHKKMRRFLLIGAKKLQLWHGNGFKRIEIDGWRHEVGRTSVFFSPRLLYLRLAAYFVSGRLVRHDALNTTSGFYRDQVFRKAFWAKEYWCTGYLRNDFGLSLTAAARELAWKNVDPVIQAQLQEWRVHGRRLVLIAPTYRDSGSIPMDLDSATFEFIDDFCEAHGIELIFKFHPFERNAGLVSGRHLHVCDKDSDIYPLFPYAAALVTDYSSISMDFLLVDKPLLFLVPEGDDYIEKDRQLQFDPCTMMPGPVVSSWHALMRSLLNEWEQDSHKEERAVLCSKVFDDLPQSEAVPKMIELMRKNKWLNTH